MRIIIFGHVILLVVGLSRTSAQGTLYLSDLAYPSQASASIGSDSWVAQLFRTGTSSGGYALNAVELALNAASGNPSGLAVSIYAYNNNNGNIRPGDRLDSLTLNGSGEPSTGGLFTYVSSGYVFSPSAYYYVVLTSSTPTAQGAYNWSGTSYYDISSQPGNYLNFDGWGISASYSSSANGLSWVTSYRDPIFQVAISATAVPEPAAGVLLGLGFAGLGFWRRQSRQNTTSRCCGTSERTRM